MVISQFGRTSLFPLIVGLAIVLASLSVPALAQSNADGGQSAVEAEALRNYEAAKAAGRLAEATQFILDYMEKSEGENAPMTVALTQRYGNLLREEGDIREAVSVLKTARERGIIAFGEHGIELFEINLDLGEAYVDRNIGVGTPKKYYDYALEVLRENDLRETTLYVRTLVRITSGLTRAGALEGALSADTAGLGLTNTGRAGSETLISSGLSSLTHAYGSGYGVLEPYMQEAVKLADVLDIEDHYLGAKVAVVQAKTKMLENVFLDAVSLGVRGSVSGIVIRENYQQEDNNLSSAIDILMEDAGQNQDFLDIANNARLDIAWLSKDMKRMTDFCSSDALNMASRYPPDRLYEIDDDGQVIAPRFSFRISGNIFRRMKPARQESWGPTQREGDKKPVFLPVCIDGRLMAVLINAPKVSIEDIN